MSSEFERSQLRDSIAFLHQSGLDRILFVLRCGLYHLTSVQGYRGIQRSGSIQPNDGRFPNTFPQSANSYGRSRGYVSLFDFETPTIRQCVHMRPVWDNFFTKRGAAKVLLKLDRNRLAASLIPNEAALEEPVRNRGVWLRHVEVWHPESIPYSYITGGVVIIPTRPIKFSVYGTDKPGLEEMEHALNELEDGSQ